MNFKFPQIKVPESNHLDFIHTPVELNVLKDRHMVFEIGDYKALYSIQESKNTLVQIFKPKTASTTTASVPTTSPSILH